MTLALWSLYALNVRVFRFLTISSFGLNRLKSLAGRGVKSICNEEVVYIWHAGTFIAVLTLSRHCTEASAAFEILDTLLIFLTLYW